MSDRDALLWAIIKNPRDRTPLLAYADMLQENPQWPAAEATAELIRLANSKKCSAWLSMPPWCLPWVEENWKRLIPSVLGINVPITEPSERWPEVPETGLFGAMNCSEINTYITLSAVLRTNYSPRTQLYSCRLTLRLGFGLIRGFEMKSKVGSERVEPLLKIDQPQLFLRREEKAVQSPETELS